MSAIVLLGVGLLGGLGAVARVVLDDVVTRRVGSAFPCGILAVNVSGALLLGAVVGATLSDDADRLLATALLGSFTTFSAWMAQTQRLAQAGRRDLAVLNVALSLVLGLAAAWLGREVGMAL